MKPNTKKGSEKMNNKRMKQNEKTAPSTSLYKGTADSKNTTEEY
tara:strand:- start:988 stop:1119 length:132 start_codon:yes stop_codon:yes gene_type:complete